MKKRIVVLIMMALAVFMCVQQPYWRDEKVIFQYQCGDGAKSVNFSKNNYTEWAEVPSSYMYYENGQYVRVELIEKEVVIERYSSDFKLISTKKLEMQLPKYGGAFHGENYNFLVFGQNNPEESNSVEVIRVVKFSKDWEEIGVYHAYGDNTLHPFTAGNCDIMEINGKLFIRTCHEMYKYSDGLNHQANLRYIIDEETMSLVNSDYSISNNSTGYVSHSFNQLQCHDDTYYYAADHGDAHPRGIYLSKYTNGSIKPYDYSTIYTVPGNTGDNYTGISIGGLEKAGNNLLTAINSANIDVLQEWFNDHQRNILLLVTSANDLSSTTVVRYTDYADDAGVMVRTPQLVKISENRLLLMWEERTDEGYWTRMVMVDDQGQPVTETMRVGASLSDCQPIIVDKSVIWYTTNGTNVVFYKIDCSSDTSLNKYSEQGVITIDALKDVLKDYEYSLDYYGDNAIVLTKYIGTSGITDLNELKNEFNLTFEIGSWTYKNNKTLKSLVLSPEINYLAQGSFSGCTSLESIDLCRVRAMEYDVFQYCNSLTEITIPATVEYMNSGIFEGCNNLKRINFEGNNIELYSAQYMFSGCHHLENIDLSVFDYSEVTTMSHMFTRCYSLHSLDLSCVDTSQVTNMSYMFQDCRGLSELDLTGFDTSNVTNMDYMFDGCIGLIKIYADDSFTVENVETSTGMFLETYFIEGGNGTTYDSNHIDKEYAVIDTPSTPGYLSSVVYEEEWKWSSDYSSASVILKDHSGNKVAELTAKIGTVDEEATCEYPGVMYYIAYAEYQGIYFYDVRTKEYCAPLGHDYEFREWTWESDYSGATANYVCRNNPTHTYYEFIPATASIKEPTCTAAGEATYTVEIVNHGVTYRDTRTERLEPLGHNPRFETIVWREDDSAYAQCTCKRCGSPTQVECTVTIVSTTATCKTPGDTTYKATCTIDGVQYSDTKTVYNKISRHDVTEIEYNWADDYSTVTAVVHCSMCEGFSETVNTTREVIREATCQNEGEIRYTAVFKSTYLTTQTETEYVWVTHDYVFVRFDWDGDWPRAEYSCSMCRDKEYEYAWKRTQTHQADCETEGGTTTTIYINAEDSPDGQYHEEKKEDRTPALGHTWELSYWNWNNSDPSQTTAVFVCQRNSSHSKEVKATVTQHADDNGNTVYEATVVLDGKTYTDTKSIKPAVVMKDPYTRIYGSNRYETSLLAADYLKTLQGVDKFDCVVLAYGQNFPDALSGSYLANMHNAPIILIKDSYATKVRDYIKKNVNKGGTVYILGGTAVIPDSWLGSLSSSFNVKRLAGSNRYGSNIEVLKELCYSGGDILVCVGTNFADSLSASAVELPILLVGNSLNDDQKKFLKKCDNVNFIIIGGTGAVTSSVEKELRLYGKVKDRIAGTNRFHTSELIAYNFFAGSNSAVLAYGRNFPDGLSGGSLAYTLQGPLLLVENNADNCAWASWVASYFNNTERALILGGKGLISDDIVRYVLDLSSKDKIKVITND